jgi:hypothetical protein
MSKYRLDSETIIAPRTQFVGNSGCVYLSSKGGLASKYCENHAEINGYYDGPGSSGCEGDTNTYGCYHERHFADFEDCCINKSGKNKYGPLSAATKNYFTSTCNANWEPGIDTYSKSCDNYLNDSYCKNTGNMLSEVCKSFSERKLTDTDYTETVLSIREKVCSNKIDELLEKSTVQKIGKLDILEIEKLGCFVDEMTTDNYKYTAGFFKKYTENIDGFIPDDKVCSQFCLNSTSKKNGSCDEPLKTQCMDKRYKSESNCSCFHDYTDSVGKQNYLDANIDTEKMLEADESGGNTAILLGTATPICVLPMCKTNPWYTVAQFRQGKDTCPTCIQMNNIGDNVNCSDGGCKQSNDCAVGFYRSEEDTKTCPAGKCGINGKCVVRSEKSDNCICNLGWGKDGKGSCQIQTDKCVAENLCKNGSCKETKCICKPGWGGKNCETVIDECRAYDQCVEGVCVNEKCECDEGWIGLTCNKKDPCNPSVVCGKGKCQNGECICDSGYGGAMCDRWSNSVFGLLGGIGFIILVLSLSIIVYFIKK